MANERERAGSGWMPRWVWEEHEARYDFAASFAAGQWVLDCACGAGIGSRRFVGAGAAHVLALDVATAQVKSLGKAGVEHLSFGVASATELPVKSGAVELFVCLETIEHVPDDARLVREAARVLKRDGVFICSTPNREVTNPGAALGDRPLNSFHVREYSREEFVSLLGTGFGSIELWGQNPSLGATPWLLGRLLRPALASRLNQALKLPRLLFDPVDHRVRPAREAPTWEYFTAVCRSPLSSSP